MIPYHLAVILHTLTDKVSTLMIPSNEMRPKSSDSTSVPQNFKMEPGGTPRCYPRYTKRYDYRVLDGGVATTVQVKHA